MGSVVLLESDPKKESLYSLNLNVYTGMDVVVKPTVKEIINLLEVLPTVSAIICPAILNDEPVEKQIQIYLENNCRDIPVLVIGQVETKNANNFYLEENATVQEVIKTVANICGVTAKKMVELVVPEYFPVPAPHFLNLKDVICDVYIRVKRNNSFQYIKRLYKGDSFEESDIMKYIRTGVETFYIPADERLQFMQSFTTQVVNNLKNKNLSMEERTIETGKAAEIVNDKVEEFGFNEDTVELTKLTLKSMALTVAKTPKLGKLLKNLLNSQASYRYQHSLLTSFVGAQIVERMEWGTKEQQEKLTFVSFFHDITLRNDEQAKIHSDEDLQNSKLPDKEKKEVNEHAKKAAALIRSYPDLPIGADTIILQHHGSRIGIGFTKNLGNGISPLALVFAVAEDFAKLLLSYPIDQQSQMRVIKYKIIEQLKQRYTTSKYFKVIEALEGAKEL